jgi:hypothetical protein
MNGLIELRYLLHKIDFLYLFIHIIDMIMHCYVVMEESNLGEIPDFLK